MRVIGTKIKSGSPADYPRRIQGKEVVLVTTMQKAVTPAITAEQRKVVADTTRSVASRIKFLRAEGFPKADVARIMTRDSGKTVSYQWVKNVLDKVATDSVEA